MDTHYNKQLFGIFKSDSESICSCGLVPAEAGFNFVQYFSILVEHAV